MDEDTKDILMKQYDKMCKVWSVDYCGLEKRIEALENQLKPKEEKQEVKESELKELIFDMCPEITALSGHNLYCLIKELAIKKVEESGKIQYLLNHPYMWLDDIKKALSEL
jgi:hypothetical protein